MLICLYISTKTFLMFSLLQHVTAEGTALVQQAEDAASSQVNSFLFKCSSLFLFYEDIFFPIKEIVFLGIMACKFCIPFTIYSMCKLPGAHVGGYSWGLYLY